MIKEECPVSLYHLETPPALFEELKEVITKERLNTFFTHPYYPCHRLNQSQLIRLFIWLIMGKKRQVYTSFEGKPYFPDQDIFLSFTYTPQTIDLIVSRIGPVAIDTIDEKMADNMVGKEMVDLALEDFSATEFAKRWTFLECAWKFSVKGLHQALSFKNATYYAINSNISNKYFSFRNKMISCVWLSRKAPIKVNIIPATLLKHFLIEQLS